MERNWHPTHLAAIMGTSCSARLLPAMQLELQHLQEEAWHYKHLAAATETRCGVVGAPALQVSSRSLAATTGRFPITSRVMAKVFRPNNPVVCAVWPTGSMFDTLDLNKPNFGDNFKFSALYSTLLFPTMKLSVSSNLEEIQKRAWFCGLDKFPAASLCSFLKVFTPKYWCQIKIG